MEKKLINEGTYPEIVHEDVTMRPRHRVVISVTDDDTQVRNACKMRCTGIRDGDRNIIFFNALAVKRHNGREDITWRQNNVTMLYQPPRQSLALLVQLPLPTADNNVRV